MEFAAGLGRIFLLLSAVGTIGGGAVIMLVGMTRVFVPQDLEYLGMGRSGLNAINPHLVPLIAHDRAGFGGALISSNLIVLIVVWKAPLNRALWQALLLSGTIGFGCAIGVHLCIGYLNVIHIAPAVAGALIFAAGMFWTVSRSAA